VIIFAGLKIFFFTQMLRKRLREDDQMRLKVAINDGDLRVIEELLSGGINVNHDIAKKRSILDFAVGSLNIQVIKTLLARGAIWTDGCQRTFEMMHALGSNFGLGGIVEKWKLVKIYGDRQDLRENILLLSRHLKKVPKELFRELSKFMF